jgi:hypothetical protein
MTIFAAGNACPRRAGVSSPRLLVMARRRTVAICADAVGSDARPPCSLRAAVFSPHAVRLRPEGNVFPQRRHVEPSRAMTELTASAATSTRSGARMTVKAIRTRITTARLLDGSGGAVVQASALADLERPDPAVPVGRIEDSVDRIECHAIRTIGECLSAVGSPRGAVIFARRDVRLVDQ